MATELAREIRGTRVKLGRQLKQEWANASATECEPLVLGDLVKGNKFIIMPTPGDNSGHGGLLNGSLLFLKTRKICHPEFPTNCIRLCDGTPLFIRDETLIIKVL